MYRRPTLCTLHIAVDFLKSLEIIYMLSLSVIEAHRKPTTGTDFKTNIYFSDLFVLHFHVNCVLSYSGIYVPCSANWNLLKLSVVANIIGCISHLVSVYNLS